MQNYFDFRCKQCNKLLGRVTGDSEIACPRCGGLNQLKFASKGITYSPKLKKPQNGQSTEYKSQLDRISKRTSSGVTFR
ncbi:MAG TPA: Com family DNA-binding transcriptional regulator [Mobilitalea sp.]|nr:Com family DNA-binding transcriptional regulator [Mobilitalea sp.]